MFIKEEGKFKKNRAIFSPMRGCNDDNVSRFFLETFSEMSRRGSKRLFFFFFNSTSAIYVLKACQKNSSREKFKYLETRRRTDGNNKLVYQCFETHTRFPTTFYQQA